MSFTARELSLKVSRPNAPDPGLQMMPICNLCDTTGGLPCLAPSRLKKQAVSPDAGLAVLRHQLRTALSRN
jgi:hypothetical protein